MTGNMVWGEFVHFHGTAGDGIPDPHLHAHCFVFNTTWDNQESRWKAGQFAGLKRDAPFFEAVFHSRLARRLGGLGLPVERTRRGWELRGVPNSAIQKFSRRTALIEEKAKERGVTNADAKGELGAKTRERKRKDLSLNQLREQWTSRLTSDELIAMKSVKGRLGEEGIAEDGLVAEEALTHAIDHCFERSSVMPERRVLTEALKRSLAPPLPGISAPQTRWSRADGCGARRPPSGDDKGCIDRGAPSNHVRPRRAWQVPKARRGAAPSQERMAQ